MTTTHTLSFKTLKLTQHNTTQPTTHTYLNASELRNGHIVRRVHGRIGRRDDRHEVRGVLFVRARVPHRQQAAWGEISQLRVKGIHNLANNGQPNTLTIVTINSIDIVKNEHILCHKLLIQYITTHRNANNTTYHKTTHNTQHNSTQLNTTPLTHRNTT